MTLFKPSSLVGVAAGESRISMTISRQSNAITIGDVVIDVHGMDKESDEQ